jgi:hypothetical protein
LWFADRQRQGFNAAIVSLIGASANGAPGDDGATVDGLLPFVDGDVLQWQEPYWARVTAYLRLAAEHGITVLLYPIDGWTIGHSFVPTSIAGDTTDHGRDPSPAGALGAHLRRGRRIRRQRRLGVPRRMGTAIVDPRAEPNHRLRTLFSELPWWHWCRTPPTSWSPPAAAPS